VRGGGLEALDRAATLLDVAGVAHAEPDWWRQRVPW
jgi:hypothetical protein